MPVSRHSFPLRSRFALLAAVASLIVATGCSSGAATEAPTESMAMSPEASMPMESGMDMGGEAETFDFGQPGDPSAADRVIEIEALDKLRYDPEELEVKVGETVTFRVHNGGKTTHELVLGSEELQEDHEQEMQEMAEGMEMHDEANAISVAAGETKDLTWTFTEAGTIQYACHEPGHFAGGMIGTITIADA